MSMSHEEIRLGKSAANARLRAALRDDPRFVEIPDLPGLVDQEAIRERASYRFYNDAEFHAKVERAARVAHPRDDQALHTARLAVAVALVMAEVEGL